MYYEIVLFFFGASLFLYAVFGGADFGAGILEFVAPKNFREAQADIITRTMGAVWEANHIWVILCVVILFTAFPQAFADACTVFHIPLTIMLFGIVARGCSFTFRHYDVAEYRFSTYSRIFAISSLVTPFVQGMIGGALILGRIPEKLNEGFFEVFINPWLNPFCVVTGLFLCLVYSLLATVFLIGEATKTEKDLYLLDYFSQLGVKILNLTSLWGMIVFVVATLSGLPLMFRFISETIPLVSLLSTIILIPFLKAALEAKSAWFARVCVVTIVCGILLGWVSVQYPVILAFHGTSNVGLTTTDTLAPLATQKQLVIALLVGSGMIFPALGYLIWVFYLQKK
jgi:cytochrome bd ubiquinol oxidase subunit II